MLLPRQILYSDGDNMCGSTNSNWDESFYSAHYTMDHTADSLKMEFTSNLNEASNNEAWGIVGLNVYLS